MENNNLKQNNLSKIGIVIVILVIAIVGYLGYTGKLSLPQKNNANTTTTLPENYLYKALPKNEYPQGFPTAVIVKEGSPEWKRAEDTIASNDKRMRIVELVYKNMAPEVLLPLFEDTFAKEGWTKNEKGSTSNIRMFDKYIEAGIVTIVPINKTDSFVNVTITTK